MLSTRRPLFLPPSSISARALDSLGCWDGFHDRPKSTNNAPMFQFLDWLCYSGGSEHVICTIHPQTERGVPYKHHPSDHASVEVIKYVVRVQITDIHRFEGLSPVALP